MEFLPAAIEEYAAKHSKPENDLLQELTRITHLKTLMPRMLSGHVQGRFLAFVSHLIRPEMIFEVGTFTGYSALCMVEGLTPTGRLVTCDVDEEAAGIARDFFGRSPYGDRIELVLDDARQVAARLEKPIDLAFIDGDKVQYREYYEAILPQLRAGGVIIADNVLWSGKVVDNSLRDEETEALRSFNTFVCADARVEALLLPLRDGLMLLRKTV